MRIRSCFAHWGGPIFDGVKVRGDYFLLDQVTVQNNMAGINITGLASNGRITNSVIFGNTYGDGSGSSGDGILLHGSNNEIDQNTFQQNHWTEGNGCRHGAAIEVFAERNDNGTPDPSDDFTEHADKELSDLVRDFPDQKSNVASLQQNIQRVRALQLVLEVPARPQHRPQGLRILLR